MTAAMKGDDTLALATTFPVAQTGKHPKQIEINWQTP